MNNEQHDCVYCANECIKRHPAGYDTNFCLFYEGWIKNENHGTPPRRNLGYCKGFSVADEMRDTWEKRASSSSQSQINVKSEQINIPNNMVELSIQYEGRKVLIDAKIEVYVNGNSLGKGSYRNGFNFKYVTNKGKHKIKLKQGWSSLLSTKINTADFNKYIINIKHGLLGFKAEKFGL